MILLGPLTRQQIPSQQIRYTQSPLEGVKSQQKNRFLKTLFYLWRSRKFVAQNSNTIYSTASVKVLLKLLGSGGIVDLGKFRDVLMEQDKMSNESPVRRRLTGYRRRPFLLGWGTVADRLGLGSVLLQVKNLASMMPL